MSDIYKNIHSIYLKNDTNFNSLSKIALSQIVLKILYFYNDKGITKWHLKREIYRHLKCKIIDKELNEVLKLREIFYRKGKYFIKKHYSNYINEEIKNHDKCFDKYVKEWSSKTGLTEVDIKTWFQEILIKFFEEFSLQWMEEICRHKSISKRKFDRTKTTFINNSFEVISTISIENKEWLSNKFWEFIEGEDEEAKQLLWIYGISMFSATLLTAKNFQDNISIELFTEGNFILDTNVIMAIGLDGSEFSKSINLLGKIFNKLKIKVYYFKISYQEYYRALSSRKDMVIEFFESLDIDVLKETNDPWIKTVIKRKYKDEKEINSLFDELMHFPTQFSSEIQLEILEGRRLEREISEGEKNDIQREKINKIQIERYGTPKRKNATMHDSGMIAGVRHLRKQNPKHWILTIDGTITKFAVENVLREEYPIAIGLDVLVGLLAINSVNMNIDATNFKPLFSNLIRSSLTPLKHSIEVEDLSTILDTHLQINILPSEVIIELAKEVNQMRIEGKTGDEITLVISRKFQKQKSQLKDDIYILKDDNLKLQQQTAENELVIENLKKSLKETKKQDLLKEYDKELRNNKLKIIIPCFGLIVLTIIFYILFSPTIDNAILYFILALIIELTGGIIFYIVENKKSFLKKESEIQKINDIVEKEIETTIKQ